jgi:SAM-dependent methyltransferase
MATAESATTYGRCDIVMGYRAVGRLVPQGSGLCLELGARRAANRKVAEARGYQYVSVDIDHYPQLSAVGDAHAVPFKDETFDLVLLPCVLEHFRDPRIALAEVHRVTKKGGLVVGQVAFLEPYHHSYFHFSHLALEDALKVAGFSNLMIDTGANSFLLIYAHLFSSFLNLDNRKAVILLSRILFPINLVLKIVYSILWLKTFVLRRDMTDFKKRFPHFRKTIALQIAGHLLFTAVRRD